MRYKAVLFDLDGTLLNTIEDIASSLNYILVKHGMKARSIEEVLSFVGNGSGKLVEKAVASGCSDAEREQILNEYREYYDTHCNIKTGPYDGIMDLLKELRQRGYKTAVVSNKPDKAVKELAKAYFGELMDCALGEGAGIARKPSPDMLFEAMKQLGVSSDEIIYVGDSEVDILTTKNAGVECISVDWGFRTRQMLIESGAGILVSSPNEILNYV